MNDNQTPVQTLTVQADQIKSELFNEWEQEDTALRAKQAQARKDYNNSSVGIIQAGAAAITSAIVLVFFLRWLFQLSKK